MTSEADHVSAVARPAQVVLARLQDERRFTAIWQSGHAAAARKDLDEARRKTDSAVQDYRRATPSALDGSTLRGTAKSLDDALVFLPERRGAIDGRTLSAPDAFQYFTTTVSDGIGLLSAALRSDDGQFARGATTTATVAQITEMLSREDALLSGAVPGGHLSAADRAQFDDALAVQRSLRTGLGAGDLPGTGPAGYARITDSGGYTTLTKIEDAVSTGQGTSLPASASAWPAAATQVTGDLQSLTSDALSELGSKSSDKAEEMLLGLLLGTLATLAALAGGAYLSLRNRRTITGRLNALQAHADELSNVWLPRLMARIEAGERIDPAMLVPQGPTPADEVQRLAASIDRLGRVAADTVLRQSLGREGGEKVFGQLIRRTQSLIHRLISLLDDLERKHEDSDLLKDIFAVDHLATRVRRHAESLVILSGSPPNRRMTTAVSIVDVMRSAVAETEQYTRVRVKNLPAERQLALAGRAVADVTHLLAELIENGTAFSPPDTQVSVSATRVAKGLVVHIEDHGLGMPQDMIDHANELLAHPPKLDMRALSEDPRLGHFVVARLAERHSIKVEVRDSVYGGTMVVVLVPANLLEELDSPVLDQLKSAASASGMMAMDAGRQAPAAAAVGSAAGGPGSDQPGDLVAAAAAHDDGYALTHTRMPEHSGFPEYGGAGLLPASADFPSPGISAGTMATGPAATGWVAPEEHPAHRQSAGQEHPAQPSRPEPQHAEPYRSEPYRPEPQRAQAPYGEPVRSEPQRPEPQPAEPQRPSTIRGTTVRTQATPSGAGLSPQRGPSGAGLSPQAGPSGAGLSPQAGPSGAGLSPQAGPSGAGLSPQGGPSGAGLSPQAGPQQAPYAPAGPRAGQYSAPQAPPAAPTGTGPAAPQPGAHGPSVPTAAAPQAPAGRPAPNGAAPAGPGSPPDPNRHLTTPPVLPQRRRGASLAQQLRREAAQTQGRPEGDGHHGGISPEASARAMIAIQQGLQRARMPEAGEPGGAGRPAEDSWRSGGNQWESGAGQWEGDLNND
ncbi:nitrate- and nitrite sensing domain-containing protein [Streptomyces sp. NPDC020917]|uniref:sensor histidine kinase n=1 Tax=Streptomyces sp. NPDC020917 TaxID=3365102 RepID=UPI0037A03B9D